MISFGICYVFAASTFLLGTGQFPDSDYENTQSTTKLLINVGIQTEPLHPYFYVRFNWLKSLTQHFVLQSDKVTVCIFAYNINSTVWKCVRDQLQLTELLKKLDNDLGQLVTSVIPMTTTQFLENSVNVLLKSSQQIEKAERYVTVVVTGRPANNEDDTVWISLANELRIRSIPVLVVDYGYDKAVALAGEKNNVFQHSTHSLPLYQKIKSLHACHVYYPICRFTDTGLCVSDWWRQHVASESECLENPGRGTPLWESPADCKGISDCNNFCDEVWHWPSLFDPIIECNTTCGPSGVKRTSSRPISHGLFYAIENCIGEYVCPPCPTTTSKPTTTPLTKESTDETMKSQNESIKEKNLQVSPTMQTWPTVDSASCKIIFIKNIVIVYILLMSRYVVA